MQDIFNVSQCRHIWNGLPSLVRQGLLLSSDAGPRLLSLAEDLMTQLASSDHLDLLTRTFADMTSFVWESSLFDTRAASVVHQVDEQIPFLEPQARALAKVVSQAPPVNQQAADALAGLLERMDVPGLQTLLEQQIKKAPANPFWRYFTRYVGLRLGELDWYEGRVRPEAVPAAFQDALWAEYLFAREDFAGAQTLFAEAHAQTGVTDFLVKQGECLLRQGLREGALHCWQRAAGTRCWMINLVLRLTDLELGRDLPLASAPPGQGLILLYSWNHGQDLDDCLRALAESERHGCGLKLLNNGSTDTTADVIEAWKERLGTELEVITLPTNVGAPAARNWLLCLEETRKADWVVFLDDDALVPPYWLGLFGKAVAEYPEAEIVGCRVVERDVPLAVQSVDLHFDAGEKDAETNREGKHLSGGNQLVPYAFDLADFGQYSYLRPAMSVTGCCHLLTRKSLDEIGLFDLRFSPSQFDDFERDLRSAAAGKLCVYQGHLRVRHIKRSGAVVGISDWQQANIGGNLFKLWHSYSLDTVRRLIDEEQAALWRDLLNRLESVTRLSS